MIGIDTNVLVRFLTGDDPAQALRAKAVMERCTPQEPGWISVIVLCEIVWVLLRGYRYSREQVAGVVARLLRTAEFEIEDSDLARQALERFTKEGFDFADALIGLRNERSGAPQTYTFDQAAAGMPQFRLVEG